jgi:hypothetical protein
MCRVVVTSDVTAVGAIALLAMAHDIATGKGKGRGKVKVKARAR